MSDFSHPSARVSGSTTLVTDGAGFIDSRVADALASDSEVQILDADIGVEWNPPREGEIRHSKPSIDRSKRRPESRSTVLLSGGFTQLASHRTTDRPEGVSDTSAELSSGHTFHA